jgi:hypothetical protein
MGRRKIRSLKRSSNTRISKRKFIIYTEGKNTEPDYFYELRRSMTGALIDFEIVEAAGVPLTIAENASTRARSISKARRAGSSFEEHDRVWAVFDRDAHPHVADACQKCESAGVGVALSNPCFEVWLILHYSDFDRPDDRHQVQKHLECICPDYDRNRRKSADCCKLIPHLATAEVRAERQLQARKREGDPLAPPFTTVFLLTREIKSASDAFMEAARIS